MSTITVNGPYGGGVRVKEDLLRGSSAGGTLLEVEITRVFQVSGLSYYQPSSVVPQATTAVDQLTGVRIPNLGTAHPDPTFSDCIVVDIRTETEPSFDVVNVFVRYRRRKYLGPYLKSVQGSLRELEYVAKKSDGTPYTITYTPTKADGTLGPVAFPGPAIFKKKLLEGQISFRLLELVDTEFFNITFAGSVNNALWRGIYKPRTAMVLPAITTTDDNVIFQNTYSILFRPETHDEFMWYVDESGQMPYDVAKSIDYTGATTSGNGWLRYREALEIDFTILFPWLNGANNLPNPNGLDPALLFNSQ